MSQSVQSNRAVNEIDSNGGQTNGGLVGAAWGAGLGAVGGALISQSSGYEPAVNTMADHQKTTGYKHPVKKTIGKNPKLFKSGKGKALYAGISSVTGAAQIGAIGMGIDGLRGGFND